jgi:hypothetical protein
MKSTLYPFDVMYVHSLLPLNLSHRAIRLKFEQPFKTPVRNQRHQRTGTGKEWQEIIVFGFPEDKISAAIKLFTSLGETREPEQGPNGANWFKIAFKHEWEAARAVRKNGELINGAWMVGVKWAVSANNKISLKFTISYDPASSLISFICFWEYFI